MSNLSKGGVDGGGLNPFWADHFFGQDAVVDHYRRATANIGLWASEELIFRRLFKPDDRLLELGTATGRIAIGLAELGYRHILATDICRNMIKEARRIGQLLETSVSFQVADATQLPFEDALFDGAIFGFNGLMQIPHQRNRLSALHEIRRVIRPGGFFVFTTHDREAPRHQWFWEAERLRWSQGLQKAELIEFGDRFEKTEWGYSYVHVPTRDSVRDGLIETGWDYIEDIPRATLAKETELTRSFSDDCIFWLVRRPLH